MILAAVCEYQKSSFARLLGDIPVSYSVLADLAIVAFVAFIDE